MFMDRTALSECCCCDCFRFMMIYGDKTVIFLLFFCCHKPFLSCPTLNSPLTFELVKTGGCRRKGIPRRETSEKDSSFTALPVCHGVLSGAPPLWSPPALIQTKWMIKRWKTWMTRRMGKRGQTVWRFQSRGNWDTNLCLECNAEHSVFLLHVMQAFSCWILRGCVVILYQNITKRESKLK